MSSSSLILKVEAATADARLTDRAVSACKKLDALNSMLSLKGSNRTTLLRARDVILAQASALAGATRQRDEYRAAVQSAAASFRSIAAEAKDRFSGGDVAVGFVAALNEVAAAFDKIGSEPSPQTPLGAESGRGDE